MSHRNGDKSEPDVHRPKAPILRSFSDVSERLQHVVDGQLDLSHQVGQLAALQAKQTAAIVELRSELVRHRGRLESVPDIVEQVVQRHGSEAELGTWRRVKGSTLKVVQHAVTAAVTAAFLYLLAKLRHWL